MNTHQPRHRLGALLAGLILMLSGCGQHYGLFNDPYSATEDKLRRYYGNDSARAATEARRKSSDMGFGLPAGFGQQEQ